jgi:hypothetical protein
MKTRKEILRGFEYGRSVINCWDGRRRLPGWGEVVDVWISADEQGPSDRQLEILEMILTYEGDLRPEFERKVARRYKEFYEPDPDDPDPINRRLERPADIWKLVEKGEAILVIPEDPPRKAVEFYIYPGCNFEEEEGVAVRYRNWKVTWVGYQSAVGDA